MDVEPEFNEEWLLLDFPGMVPAVVLGTGTEEEDNSLDIEALKQILQSSPCMRNRTRKLWNGLFKHNITSEICWNHGAFLGQKFSLMETINEWDFRTGWQISEEIILDDLCIFGKMLMLISIHRMRTQITPAQLKPE